MYVVVCEIGLNFRIFVSLFPAATGATELPPITGRGLCGRRLRVVVNNAMSYGGRVPCDGVGSSPEKGEAQRDQVWFVL